MENISQDIGKNEASRTVINMDSDNESPADGN